MKYRLQVSQLFSDDSNSQGKSMNVNRLLDGDVFICSTFSVFSSLDEIETSGIIARLTKEDSLLIISPVFLSNFSASFSELRKLFFSSDRLLSNPIPSCAGSRNVKVVDGLDSFLTGSL